MIHTLFGTQNQNQDFNLKRRNENIKNMRKGVMVNGSEVYYGTGRNQFDQYKTYRIPRGTNRIKSYNNNNKVVSNRQINYVGKEEKRIKTTVYTQKVVNTSYEKISYVKKGDDYVECPEPTISISIRLYNGNIINGKFLGSHKLKDIYNYVKDISHRINFDLLIGFPPKPLTDYTKTISELGLDNTMLTQKVG